MNRIVVITGASAGLGLALAKRFVEDGDRVFGVSRTKRNWDAAHRTIGDPTLCSLKRVDVTVESQVNRFIKNVIRAAGKVDIIVNNAGFSNRPMRVEKLSLGAFQKNVSSNLLASFLVCKHAIPILRRQKSGLIINISSMAGKRAVPLLAAYSASKFGVVALSQSIAKENPDAGFKCFTVCPGGMNTIMREKLFGVRDAQKQQSADFVADIIFQVATDKIKVESGGDIVIRHGKVTAVNPLPVA